MAIVTTPAYGFDRTINRGANLAPVVKPAASFLEEDADSPKFEFAEQATCTHSFSCDLATGLANIVGRGTYIADSFGYIWRVLSCTLGQVRGNVGKLVIVTESISFNVPPDEYSCQSVEFSPPLEKHPRYGGTSLNNPVLSPNDFQLIHNALEMPQTLSREEALNQFATSNFPALCAELYAKKIRGEETYYLSGKKITWAAFSWAPTVKDPGGYIQSPTVILPASFYIGANGATTLPNNWSWLRQADDEEFQRTWFRHTRTWIGAPNGYWDTDIYHA